MSNPASPVTDAWAGPIRARKLDHVVLRVADLDRSIRFYGEVLGCPVERRLDELGLVQLRAGESLIDLVDIHAPLGVAGGGDPRRDGPNMDHFALSLVDFDEEAIRRHLASLSVEAGETGNRYGADGYGASIYLRDPDGNTLELKAPPSSPPKTIGHSSPTNAEPLADLKRRITRVVHEMDRAGLTEGTAGNVSARTAENEIILTPTAMRYPEMVPNDLVVTDLTGKLLDGSRPATTEIDLHLACLRRYPEIGAVVHTHAVHASMFAVAGKTIPCLLEEFEYFVGGDVKVAPYFKTGTPELGDAVADCLSDRAAALMANHGLVVVGKDIEEALHITKLVERAARIIWGARSLGEDSPLPQKIRTSFSAAYNERRKERG